jgi:hypothetical protein
MKAPMKGIVALVWMFAISGLFSLVVLLDQRVDTLAGVPGLVEIRFFDAFTYFSVGSRTANHNLKLGARLDHERFLLWKCEIVEILAVIQH